MISFKEYNGEPVGDAAMLISSALPGADAEYVCEILESFSALCLENEDISVAYSTSFGCLLVRIFDMGRYSFVYPIAVCDEACELAAVDKIRAYSVKEEIPLVITDIPREAVGEVVGAFRHIELDSEDPSSGSYRAFIKSEVSLLSSVPHVQSAELSLGELYDTDASRYANLCRDADVNKYWGYDFRADADGAQDEYFLDTARSELSFGTALTLAVRFNGEFVGEAVLYHFDLVGGAEIGFRLLPEFWGRGIGGEVISLLREVAAAIGLLHLHARVMKENVRSVRLLTKNAAYAGESDGCIEFEIDI